MAPRNLSAALTNLVAITGNGNIVFSDSPTLVNPHLGTPASGNLTNCILPTSIIQGPYTTANTALSIGQSAFEQANAALTIAQAGTAANVALATAQSAYNTANTKFSSSGGTISGSVTITTDLSVTGNVYLNGNVTTLNSNNLSINDSLIYMAQDNPANLQDIGLVGHFTDSKYQHTGLVRDATDGVWKLFSNVATEPTTTINFTEAVYDTLKVGSIITSNASLGNVSNVHIYGGSSDQFLVTDGSGNLNFIDFPTPTTDIYLANSIIQTNGVYVSGNLSSIQTFGDYAGGGGSYVLTDGSSSAPAWTVDFDFLNVIKFNRVVMSINYTQSSGHTIYVQLYNITNSTWDSIGTYTGLGSYYGFALDVIESIHYISSGRVQLRLYHSNAGNVAHQTNIDYISLEQSYQGPQGPKGLTGTTGATGATGQGVAAGGNTGQVLIKNSNTNYDTTWSDIQLSKNFNLFGQLIPTTGTARFYPHKSITITSAYLTIGIVSPSTTILNINKNGTLANTISLPANAYKSNTVQFTTSISLTTNDYITADLLSTGGENLTLTLIYI